VADQSIFDKPGNWEIRTAIYRNGRKVAFADALGDDYDFAVGTVATHLERRDVDMHQPKPRRALNEKGADRG
jgi:hypothetical protein